MSSFIPPTMSRMYTHLRIITLTSPALFYSFQCCNNYYYKNIHYNICNSKGFCLRVLEHQSQSSIVIPVKITEVMRAVSLMPCMVDAPFAFGQTVIIILLLWYMLQLTHALILVHSPIIILYTLLCSRAIYGYCTCACSSSYHTLLLPIALQLQSYDQLATGM